MKQLFTIFFLIVCARHAFALTVSGVVYNESDRKPVPNVTVGIDELQIITETDSTGAFSLSDISQGHYTLTFSHEAYGRTTRDIRVKRTFYIEHILKQQIYDSGSKIKTHRDELHAAGDQSITRDDIKTYPMRGVGDSTHLLQTLPGVAGGFSLATVPVIRATNPLFNKYYVDDIPIDYPFHYAGGMVPIFSAINEEAIDSISVIKGNAPLWTSDNLGNTVMIKSAEAEKSGINGKIILDPILPVIPTFVASIVPRDDMSVVAVGRRSNIDWLFDAEKANVSISDYFLKFTYNPASRHRFVLTGLGSKDYVDYNDLYTESGFSANGLSWEYLAHDNLLLKTVVSNQRFIQQIKNEKEYSSGTGAVTKFDPEQYRLLQMMTLSFSSYYVKAGYEIIKYKNGSEGNVSLADLTDENYLRGETANVQMSFPIEGTSYSGFLSAGGRIDRVRFDGGIKYESYGPLSEKALSYNAEGGYDLNEKTSVYAKTGRYYAHPDVYYYLGSLDRDFKLAEAYNHATGVNHRLNSGIFFQAEAYYSKYNHLDPGLLVDVEDEWTKKLFQLSPFADEDNGYTYGLELSAKGDFFGLTGWVTYSYSVAKRNSEKVNDFYSDFDQTHLFRVVLSKELGRWMLSAILHLNSGQPYTPVNGSSYNGTKWVPSYDSRNSARFDMSKRIDLKCVYKTAHGSRIFAEAWIIPQNNIFIEKFDDDDAYEYGHNPKTLNDNRLFLWAGMEICL